MNLLACLIWLLINVFLGAPLAYTLFHWIACDMQMPLVIKDLIGNYVPILSSVFNVPYVEIPQISSSIIAKLIFNAFLCAIFGFIHTFFAQESVQIMLRQYFAPKQTLRTIYCVLVTLSVFLTMGFWQHTHIQLWNWLPSTMNQYEQHVVLLIIYTIIALPTWFVAFIFDPLEFSGVKQIFKKIESIGCPYSSSVKSKDRTTGNLTLITNGLFRFCRHPMYLFSFLAWIITPVMSLDRLMITIYISIYAMIAVPIEERKLIQIFGQDYINYQKHTPMIFPFFMKKVKQY